MERTEFERWKSKEVARLLALVETERRYYQQLISALPAPVAVVSADEALSYANRAFRAAVDLRGELHCKCLDRIFPGLGPQIQEAQKNGTTLHVTAVANGKTFNISIVPLREVDADADGETLLLLEELKAGEPSEQPAPEPAEPPAPPEPPPAVPEPTPELGPAPALEPEPEPSVPTAEPGTPAAPAEPAFDGPIPPNIPSVFWQADASTLTFISVAGSTEEMLGFPPAEWLADSRFFENRIHPDDRAATMALYRGVLETGGEASAEFRSVTASGEIVYCRETIRVPEPKTELDGGEAARIVSGVLNDISRRTEFEQQIVTAARVEGLQTIAGRLAHDLNNPLMIATGYGEEILNALTPGSPERADMAELVAAVSRIAGIASQLTDFGKRHANPPTRVNLTAMLIAMEPGIAEGAGRGVALEISTSGEPVWAAADADQLRDAILALTSKTRPGAQGRKRLSIVCSVDTIRERIGGRALAPGKYARIVISDDGQGLESEQRQALFESVFSGKDPDSPGPALARAYTIIREWGGSVSVSSVLLNGATLTIYLPYSAPPEVEAAPPEPAPVEEAPAAEPPPEPLRETILIVDDEPGIRGLIRKILRREHYRVLEAGTAEEALTIAVSHAGPISLLLTDVMLPGLNGRELAKRMYEAAPDLKVLYISGFTEDESDQAEEYPPGSRFLAKPFTLSALVKSVRQTLDGTE